MPSKCHPNITKLSSHHTPRITEEFPVQTTHHATHQAPRQKSALNRTQTPHPSMHQTHQLVDQTVYLRPHQTTHQTSHETHQKTYQTTQRLMHQTTRETKHQTTN